FFQAEDGIRDKLVTGVQTCALPIFILHELGPYFRIVWLNSKHPEDPDPQWWGHSIGWYENGDTLVVDTIGFNDKTWLDQMGHPRSEERRVGKEGRSRWWREQ